MKKKSIRKVQRPLKYGPLSNTPEKRKRIKKAIKKVIAESGMKIVVWP